MLIASFFGIGIGLLLAKMEWKIYTLFPILLFFIVSVVVFFKIDIGFSSQELIYFRNTPIERDLYIPLYVIAPFLYIFSAVVFVPLGQMLGRFLNQLPPLYGYIWDIVGSILGIVVFTFVSIAGLSPLYWFMISAVVYIVILAVNRSRFRFAAIILIFVCGLVYLISQNTI